MGNRSVRFVIALFRQGDGEAAAWCDWVHVFVDRPTERPTEIPPALRPVFESYRRIAE